MCLWELVGLALRRPDELKLAKDDKAEMHKVAAVLVQAGFDVRSRCRLVCVCVSVCVYVLLVLVCTHIGLVRAHSSLVSV